MFDDPSHERLLGRPSKGQQGPIIDSSGIARGFRLSTELVVAVLLGAAIGWLIDRWLGISPWGMIVFLLLGFAAGVVNVMRAAGVLAYGRLNRANSKNGGNAPNQRRAGSSLGC